jgi:hypothetical protein
MAHHQGHRSAPPSSIRGQTTIRSREGALSWLAMNGAQMLTLFALSNLWMSREYLLEKAG